MDELVAYFAPVRNSPAQLREPDSGDHIWVTWLAILDKQSTRSCGPVWSRTSLLLRAGVDAPFERGESSRAVHRWNAIAGAAGSDSWVFQNTFLIRDWLQILSIETNSRCRLPASLLDAGPIPLWHFVRGAPHRLWRTTSVASVHVSGQQLRQLNTHHPR